MNKIAVFFFVIIFALLMAIPLAFPVAFNLPISAVCNYSTGSISNPIQINDYLTLANVLRGQNLSAGCGFQANIYALGLDKQILGSVYSNDLHAVATQSGGNPTGYTTQDTITIDPDQIWSYFAYPFPENDIPIIRFVEDPFALLNSSENYNPAFINFHRNGADKSVSCQSQPEKGSVNSSTECVEYTINKKYADCKGTMSKDACCGDDDLIDPGFEATDAEKNLDVWQRDCRSDSFCYKDSGIKHSGANSLHIKQTNQSQSISQNQTLPAGEYYLSFWINSQNIVAGYPWMKTNLPNANITLPGNTGVWKHYVMKLTLTTETPLTIAFFVPSDPADSRLGHLYIDDVHLMSNPLSAATFLTDYGLVDTALPPDPSHYLCYFKQTEW